MKTKEVLPYYEKRINKLLKKNAEDLIYVKWLRNQIGFKKRIMELSEEFKLDRGFFSRIINGLCPVPEGLKKKIKRRAKEKI